MNPTIDLDDPTSWPKSITDTVVEWANNCDVSTLDTSDLKLPLEVEPQFQGAMALGLLSISTASPGLMLGWFAGQSVELGVAGAVIGSGLSGTPLRKILVRVIVLILVLVVATIIMQNIGLAPAVVIGG